MNYEEEETFQLIWIADGEWTVENGKEDCDKSWLSTLGIQTESWQATIDFMKTPWRCHNNFEVH